jgi:hypothetical protein
MSNVPLVLTEGSKPLFYFSQIFFGTNYPNFSLLTVTYSSVITTLVYNDKIFSPFDDVITEFVFCLNLT